MFQQAPVKHWRARDPVVYYRPSFSSAAAFFIPSWHRRRHSDSRRSRPRMSQWSLVSLVSVCFSASLYCVSCEVFACPFPGPFSSRWWRGWIKVTQHLPDSVAPAQATSVGGELSCSAGVLIVVVRLRHIHSSVNCTGWRQESELISSSLSLSTSVSTEQHRRTLPKNLASRQTSRLDVVYVPSLRWLSAVRGRRLSTIGDRAFPVTAARVWNSLPQQHNITVCLPQPPEDTSL